MPTNGNNNNKAQTTASEEAREKKNQQQERTINIIYYNRTDQTYVNVCTLYTSEERQKSAKQEASTKSKRTTATTKKTSDSREFIDKRHKKWLCITLNIYLWSDRNENIWLIVCGVCVCNIASEYIGYTGSYIFFWSKPAAENYIGRLNNASRLIYVQ